MKQAEIIRDENRCVPFPHLAVLSVEQIKQIQLDAFKAGERFAVELNEKQKKQWPSEQGVMYGAGYEAGISAGTKAILTDANNRTELP